ncbi:TPA: hypothetical protein EYG59_20025 [Candidatus Poribacteria bacterium]|nr:hypothetical protein [Candidatus Poribacteria bacterium]
MQDGDYPKGENLEEEKLTKPRGWNPDSIKPVNDFWQLDKEEKFTGDSSVKIISTAESFDLATENIEVSPELVSVNSEIMAKGSGGLSAKLRWIGLKGILREDQLTKSEREDNGWIKFYIDDVEPPKGAKWLQFICETMKNEDSPTWWDDAKVIGEFVRPKNIEVLVNQVGYDVDAPKKFTVQSNFLPEDKKVKYELVDEDGKSVFAVPLAYFGRMKGAYGNDWGKEYWRGDMTDFNTPGEYKLRVRMDGEKSQSYPFKIEENLLWNQTSYPAYKFFYYQRCGMEIPDFHGACHLDDAVTMDGEQLSVAGGWHDAGDYNAYTNAPYVFGLLRAYTIAKSEFDDQDRHRNKQSDFLDEILWGADHVRRLISPDGSGYGFWAPPELETDNIPGTGDERKLLDYGGDHNDGDTSEHIASMARIAHYLNDDAQWIESAERGLKWAIDNGKNGSRQFSATVDLYALTKNERYARRAHELFPKSSDGLIEAIESVELYDQLFNEDHSELLKKELVKEADQLLEISNNPFGLIYFWNGRNT